MEKKNNLRGKITALNTFHTDAYAIAVKHGFDGTEEEWLASLKGEKGERGEKGEKGEKGENGEKGEKGENGGTHVTSGGEFQSEWNADSKVSTAPDRSYVLYGRGETQETVYPIQTGATRFAVPQRDTNGCVKTASPKAGDDAVNLTYFNLQMESRDETVDGLAMRVNELEETGIPSSGGGWNKYEVGFVGSGDEFGLPLESGVNYLISIVATPSPTTGMASTYFVGPFIYNDNATDYKVPINPTLGLAPEEDDEYGRYVDATSIDQFYMPAYTAEGDSIGWNITVYYQEL